MIVCTINVITVQFFVISGIRMKAIFPRFGSIKYIYSAKG